MNSEQTSIQLRSIITETVKDDPVRFLYMKWCALRRQTIQRLSWEQVNEDTNPAFSCTCHWDLTSAHFPELNPPIHASCGQQPGAWAKLHGVDFPVMGILQDRQRFRPSQSFPRKRAQINPLDAQCKVGHSSLKRQEPLINYLGLSVQALWRFYYHFIFIVLLN